ncbi:6-phosphogluconolactonase [Maricaulis sp.]|uniref:6-phosphogluconolactonase n=1 Tax=Maricaulis sp. TaxID=1486257 RepID=UPI0026346F66|nr:6-phosphogluconolactonase [Maricaulis sp.]
MPSPADTLIVERHGDRDAMVDVLAEKIAAQLRAGIAARRAASFAVSGGSTPAPLYTRLSAMDVEWDKVTVVLVDERWVDRGEAGSNADFVAGSLLQNAAAAARFVELKTADATPKAGLAELETRLAGVPQPFDAIVLGMGGDGHTASWFPHAEGLAGALDPDAGTLAAVRAHPSDVTGPFLDRMTLTKPALDGAGLNVLMLTGQGKLETLEVALEDGLVEDMPVRALLRQPAPNFEIHWAG